MGGGGLKGGTGDTGSIKYKKDAWEESILYIYYMYYMKRTWIKREKADKD